MVFYLLYIIISVCVSVHPYSQCMYILKLRPEQKKFDLKLETMNNLN